MKKKHFSHLLDDLICRADASETLSLVDLIETVGPKGHAFLTLFLALPFAQPIPLPGLSIAVGLVISLAGLLMALDRPLWLPRRLARGSLSSASVRQLCLKLKLWQERLARGIGLKPHAIFARTAISRWIGLWIAVLGLLLSLPLPIPTSNLIPAIAILFLSFAALEEDVRVLSLGFLLVLGNLVFFSALFVLPFFGVSWLTG